MIISNDMLFYAFLFAAFVFFVMAYVFHVMYARMGVLNKTLECHKTKLKESMATGDKLQKSLDTLILRRTELQDCLNAAKTDEERVACIRKLMDE
jgi:hypothetical protein